MNRIAVLGACVVAQLALVGLATYDQLSARAFGEEYRFLVQPVDPHDPFRGSYVDLDYPDLRDPDGSVPASFEDGDQGPLYIPLVRDGDLWVRGEYTRTRPDEGPYLACDDGDWRIRCGIESWFASQSEAREIGRELAEDGGVAVVRIDSRGHAAIVDLESR